MSIPQNGVSRDPISLIPLFSLREVTKTFPTSNGEFYALKAITTEIYKGEFLGIIGKSGAGKSTLLNMISGVDQITKGEIFFHPPNEERQIAIHQLSENELAKWRGRNVGVIYQSFQLLPMLTLLENVMLPMDICGQYQSRRSKERAYELLKLVELENHIHKLPAYISGGQQQRVAIARALANNPPILIADEPTGSLDSITADAIFRVFENLIEEGRTIIMVTHDNSLAPRFSRKIFISDGQIKESPAT